MSIIENTVEVKPYGLTELAAIYNVTNRTMKNWLKPFEKEIGEKIGRIYTAKQVKVIFEKLGLPGRAEE